MSNEGLEDFKAAQVTVKERHGAKVRGNFEGASRRWRMPGINEVKANWDATLDIENKRMGIEIVIRDAEGEILASIICSVRRNVAQPTLEKFLALWKTLEIYNELAFSKVNMEGDVALVINGVNNVEEDYSWMGHIIEDIKIFLKGRKEWRVRYIPREGNNVAHLLAKHALSLEEEKIWIEGVPFVITSALRRDKGCTV